MGRRGSESRLECYATALEGKKIPILTLDNKWYRLLTAEAKIEVSGLEKQLNALLMRQGKLNTETKDIKRLKKKLLNEIMSLTDEAAYGDDASTEQKIATNKRLVEECNEKLDGYQDELKDLPREIEQVNLRLMQITMDCCYEIMQDNTEEIQEISQWVKETRIELKKRLIQKQEMEQRNYNIYSYMHDLFGPEVIDLFDMKYNPEDRHPKG